MARTRCCLTPSPVVSGPLQIVRAVTAKPHSRCDSGLVNLVAVKREAALPSGGGESTWRSGSNRRLDSPHHSALLSSLSPAPGQASPLTEQDGC